MAYLTFGDEPGPCLGILEAPNHGVDQLIRIVWIPPLLIAFDQLIDLVTQVSLQIQSQVQLIGLFPAFQGELAVFSSFQLLQEGFLANHHGGKLGTGWHLQVKVAEIAVVSHKARPIHGNALSAIWS